MLSPTRKPVRGAAANAAANQPYAPISKPQDEGQIPEIEMFVGESRVFPAPGVARIAVGNGSLLTAAALDNKEVILFANGAGTSSLFIWNADGRYQRVKISIVPGDTSRQAREIAAFLSTIPKTRASVVGANIIVEGDELSDDDQAKIKLLTERYPQIVNFTNRLGWEQMVAMDVKVVEFPSSELREIGLKWTPTGGAAVGGIWGPIRYGNGGPYQINLQTGTNNPAPITNPNGGAVTIPSGLNALGFMNMGLNAQLNLLAQDGRATVLAEPQLSARSGSQAKFLAGGEIPYSVYTREGLSVLFKPYGVKLEITPRVDRHGVIRASITIEVSSIDGSLSTTAGPALLTRRTDTEFNVREGESIVLSGLLQRESNNSVDKVPVLGDLPILGALFRSKRYQNKETELVVFVTPKLVTAKSPGVVDRIERTTERLEERMGAKPYLTDPLQPGVSYERPNQVVPRAPVALAPEVLVGSLASLVEPADPGKTEARNPALDTMGGSRLVVTVESTGLRAKPSSNSPLLMTLHRGATVRLADIGLQTPGPGGWREVVVGAVVGWVPTASVQAIDDPAASPRVLTPPAAAQQAQAGKPALEPLAAGAAAPLGLAAAAAGKPAAQAEVGLSGLALRSLPDMNAPVLMQLRLGASVTVLPQAARGAWTPVQVGEGAQQRKGWVASQWLRPQITQ